MATKRQIAAAKHAREMKQMKQKYAQKWGLAGIGLGNLKTMTKAEAFDIIKDGGGIALGLVGGKIVGNMLKKAIVKPGEEESAKKWVDAASQVGAGFLVSALGKKNRFVISIGQGMFASGVVTGIETATKRSITDLLSLSTSSSDTTDEEREEIAGLGKTIQEIEDIDFELDLEDPELNGAEKEDPNKEIIKRDQEEEVIEIDDEDDEIDTVL